MINVPLACFQTEVIEAIERVATDEGAYDHEQIVGEAVTWREETRALAKARNEDAVLARKEAHDAKLRGSPHVFNVGDLYRETELSRGTNYELPQRQRDNR